MPFVRQKQINPEVRSQYETALKEQLRLSLLNPGLTPEQRSAIKDQLDSLGHEKVYTADSPPKPGAITLK
jgi:hypothetical protein